jgi:hypothetical protein
MARYLWDADVSAVAADNPGVEAELFPGPGAGAPVLPQPFDVMHRVVTGARHGAPRALVARRPPLRADVRGAQPTRLGLPGRS